MKVLFIGGTGLISSACSELCIEKGIELWVLNRQKSFRALPKKAKVIKADISNVSQSASILVGKSFDVVVDWIAYEAQDVKRDFELFYNKTRQYIFISSASAYQKPVSRLPITESTILCNPYWQYSRDKIACEELLIDRYRHDGFPVTIVRPSHTYDRTEIPLLGGYTALDRMRKGKKVVVHGDGTSLWTLTHHRDFAKGFIGLLGNHSCIGEVYHITSDEVLTWNQIYEMMGQAAGVKPEMVYVPSTIIAAHDKELGDSLLGDKAHSVIFDNTKIKRAVPGFCAAIPFSRGAYEIVEWYDVDKTRQVVDQKINSLMDNMINTWSRK